VIGATFPALLAAARHGDETAFSALWRDANPALLRYLAVVAPEAAEDVASEVWLHVVRGLHGFKGDEPQWRAWLFTLARRRAIDEGRKRSRRPTRPLSETSESSLPVEADTADLAMDLIATKAALAVIATLPPVQAEVIMLRVVGGLEPGDVARLLGRSPGAVRVAAHRGLRRLADVLATEGVTR
jgi:RNA polymerase sigma-70 factor (ECF subfamily)